MDQDRDHFWVFGYGSLMWRPGFSYDRSELAQMFGVHRSPCIYSWVHRGTKERPGIVLGLDQGGICTGTAFQVDNKLFAQTVDYLRERELVTNVYLETTRKIRLASGASVEALTYIVDRTHDQYAGKLNYRELLAQIQGAVGKSGPNEEYIISTAKRLGDLGIRDKLMEKLLHDLHPH